MPEGAGCPERLPRDRTDRQRGASRGACLQCKSEVLGEDVDSGPGGVIAGEHARHAVGEHPARARTRGHDIDDGSRIKAEREAERHALASGGQVDPRHVVVDELHLRAVAGARAHVEALAGDGVEYRADLLAGFRVAGDHHRHGSVARARGAARHRRVERPNAVRRKTLGERPGEIRRDGAAHDEHAAGPHARTCAVRAKHDLLGLRRVDDERDDRGACPRDLLRRGAHHGTGLPRLGICFRANVAHVDFVSLREQALRDAHAHRADSDHSDPCRHPCLQRLNSHRFYAPLQGLRLFTTSPSPEAVDPPGATLALGGSWRALQHRHEGGQSGILESGN